jgi:lipopolysaccharide transport protein LptA
MRKFIKVFLFALFLLPVEEGSGLGPPSRGGQPGTPVRRGENTVASAGVATPTGTTTAAGVAPDRGSFSALGGTLPLSISSDQMTVKGLEDTVLFQGTVLIQKGDVTIKAGRAEVLLSNTNTGTTETPNHAAQGREGKEIARIEVTEDVELTQGGRRVLAQRGIYDAKEGEIVLTGEPEMWEEGYHVKGKAITLSLKHKRSFVEGSELTIN